MELKNIVFTILLAISQLTPTQLPAASIAGSGSGSGGSGEDNNNQRRQAKAQQQAIAAMRAAQERFARRVAASEEGTGGSGGACVGGPFRNPRRSVRLAGAQADILVAPAAVVEAEKCPVCLDPMKATRARFFRTSDHNSTSEATCKLPCNHKFHVVCIDTTLRATRSQCPYCRQTVDEEHGGYPQPVAMEANPLIVVNIPIETPELFQARILQILTEVLALLNAEID